VTRIVIGAAGMALLVALLGWFHLLQIRLAREQGARDERLVWQQRQAVAEAKAEADRKAAQEKINAAERTYLQTRAAADVQKSELKKALDNEKASARACAAVTRELRDRLQDIRGTYP
jgi:hypothetical protein